MKKADLVQALAEEAAENLNHARVLEHFNGYERPNSLGLRYEAGINLAAINHINGVSPTQE